MNILKSLCLGVAALGFTAMAEEPIITFHTNLYSLQGESNVFTFYLGSTEDTYVDVDCGFGSFEVEVKSAVFDTDTSSIQGTPVTCTVDSNATVKVYGDASLIDFVDMEGCYISNISWPEMTEVRILNMEYNQLEALDLSHMTKLQAAYLNGNEFKKESPLIIGPAKTDLVILQMNMVDWLDPNFDMTQYPKLAAFSAYACPELRKADTSNCPDLLQLSIDESQVESLDLSNNPKLLILNVSDTRVTNLDLSHNPYLTELYCQHESAINSEYKITNLDLSNNPEIVRLYVNGNKLSTLDLSKQDKLVSFACRRNLLETLNFDNMPNLTLVDISLNNMDFNTMPLPRETFSQYDYAQNDMPVDRVYAEGTTLDFTNRVMRDDSETYAVLLAINREDPGNPIELSDDYFTFDRGKMILNKAYPDSVYASFYNTAFPEHELNTTRFMVKTAADFGKPTAAVKLNTSILAKAQSMHVGIDGATAENPIKFMVDFGNGTLVEFEATTSDIPLEANVNGTRASGTTTIYTPEGVDLTALKIDGMRLNGIDVENAAMLRQLVINNCALPSINLKWNRCLTLLDLSDNSLTTVDLSEPNAYYNKTMLGNIYLANNKITSFTSVDPYGLRNLDVSNNRLTEIVLDHATGLVTLNCSNNLIEAIDLEDCESLTTLKAANNLLTELPIPMYVVLNTVDISGNRFTIPKLPLVESFDDYHYAPQAPMTIPTKAPSVNLSSQFVDLWGETTQYEWRYAADNSVVPDGYIIDSGNGRFKFANPDTGDVYCAISHPLYPEFEGDNVITTSVVATAEKPTNVFISFVPAESTTATLSVAAYDPSTAIYVDWTGEGDFEQYQLATTYQLFTAETQAGVEVKCYSYDDNDGVSVFSIQRCPLESLDASGLSNVATFGISGCSIPEGKLTLPNCQSLREFIADNSGLKTLPLDQMQNLEMLAVSRNGLETLDVTSLKKLKTLYAADNALTEVKLDNPLMWELSLTGNNLETIDLTGVPAMEQLWLSHNNLNTIDLSPATRLKVLTIDNNRFDFTTLPLPSSSYYLYNYVDQQPLAVTTEDGRVDLSSQATVGGQPTTYTWYIDSPYFDDNGTLTGEDLYVDEEYTIDGGVTTFLYPYNHIMCVMTNPTFPNLYLYTDFIDVVAAGVESVTIDGDADSPIEYYDLQGRRIDNPAPGIYIRRQGNTTQKIVIR